MASQFDLIRNRERGDEARKRVMERVSNPASVPAASPSKFDAIRNRATVPNNVGTPMSELQPKFGAVTPLNLMNAAVYDSLSKQAEQPQITEYDRRMAELDESKAPAPIKAFARGMTWLTYGNPVGQFVSRAGHQADKVLSGGKPATIQPDTGSKVANVAADVAGSFLTIAAPTGAPVNTGPLAGSYKLTDDLMSTPIAQRVEQGIANKLAEGFKPQLAQKITREAIREGGAGTVQGLATGMMTADTDNKDLLVSAATGGALGVGLGGLMPIVGSGLSKLLKRNGIPENEIAEILALPEGKLDTRLAAAAERSNLAAGTDPIINDYTFDLPEATPGTKAVAENAAEGRTALKEIDQAINELNTRYEQAVIDEYKFLKESRDSRGGVQQGALQQDAAGEVIGRTGRMSDNPLWYQEFYAANGKRPSNKDLFTLARERVDNGFVDEAGQVPSWRETNGYDDQLSGLTAVRENLQNGIREIDPALKIVDQPIISQELKDTRIVPGERKQRPAAQIDDINDRLMNGGRISEDDLDLLLSQNAEPAASISPELPAFDPNAEPILRPGQFDEQTGLGISAVKKLDPYDSLKTDTRSQLTSRQKEAVKGLAIKPDRLYTALVDDLHPLNQQDKILDAVMGEKIPTNQRVHDLGLASRGADVVAKRIITDGLVDANGQVVGDSLKSILAPLKPLMKKNKHIYVDFEDYLLNKHAITRFERGEKVFRDDLNWSPTYGSRKVAEYEQMFPQFKEMSEGLYEFQNQMAQKWLVDTGMIPQAMLDSWMQQNPFYVPNKRFFSELEKTGAGFGGKKKGFGNQSDPVKGYQVGGSQRLIISPIEAMIENVDAFVKSAKRNKVMQQYAENIQQAPEDFAPWAEIVKQPEKPEDIAKIVLDEGGLDELLFRFSADFDKAMQRTQLDKDNIVRVLIDGEAQHVKIKDKQLLSALTALGPENSGFLLNAIGKLTNTMKLLTTGSNPVFSLTRNLFRDIPQAYIASKTTNNPIAFAADLASAAVDIARQRGAYKDFLNIGGGHASSIAADRNLLAQSKRAILPQSGLKPTLGRVKDAYENVLNAVEIAPRLSEFKRIQRQGGDLQAALKEAQDLTVNFKRRGALSGEVDKVFPYFNAAMQGMDKTVRTYLDDPAKALVKSIMAITLPTLALYAINRDDPKYQRLSNRTKDAYLMIPKGDGTFIKIAKPQEQGTIFSDIPERLMRLLAEEDPAAFRDFADRLRTTMLPPGIQGAMKGGGITDRLLGAVGDTILGPVADVAANETFSGAPIVPGNLERLSPGLQADAKTTDIARWIGEQTYGTPFEQSPKKLDYLARQYSGFLGQFGQPLLSPGGDVGYALSQQMTADPVFSNDLSTEFYNYKDKLDQAYADRALVDLPEWYSDPLRKRLNKISQNMSAVRKEIREVQGDTSLSNADKRAKLRELQERINRMAEMGNSLAREVVPY